MKATDALLLGLLAAHDQPRNSCCAPRPPYRYAEKFAPVPPGGWPVAEAALVAAGLAEIGKFDCKHFAARVLVLTDAGRDAAARLKGAPSP